MTQSWLALHTRGVHAGKKKGCSIQCPILTASWLSSLQVNKWRCRNSAAWVAELLCQQVLDYCKKGLAGFLLLLLLEECFDAGFGYDGDDCSQGWPSLNFQGYAAKHRLNYGAAVLSM